MHEVAPLIKLTAAQRAKLKVTAIATATVEAVKATPAKVMGVVEWFKKPETQERLAQDAELVKDIVRGKAKERFGPLVAKLAGKAYFENNPEVSHVVREDAMDAIAAEE